MDMGSNNLPPPHVPSHTVPVCGAFLQVGGTLWTICYLLLLRESRRSKSYGMPLFALAQNFAWEIVYALYVTETTLELTVFTIWMLIDCGLVYYMLKYGKNEWAHAPFVQRHLGTIFLVFIVYCAVAQYSFAKWWIDNDMGKREGKYYRGVIGPDTTELGFWSSSLAQAFLSAASLAQLMVRQHTGGVSWGVWITRNLGSIIGLYFQYGWAWYYWREAHEYFMSSFGILLWGTGLACDLVYPFFFYHVRKTEKVLPDGTKTRGESTRLEKKAL